jgi:hypothetical protein
MKTRLILGSGKNVKNNDSMSLQEEINQILTDGFVYSINEIFAKKVQMGDIFEFSSIDPNDKKIRIPQYLLDSQEFRRITLEQFKTQIAGRNWQVYKRFWKHMADGTEPILCIYCLPV